MSAIFFEESPILMGFVSFGDFLNDQNPGPAPWGGPNIITQDPDSLTGWAIVVDWFGLEERTEGHGVEVDENGNPILEFEGVELQWRDEYDFLFWTISIDGDAQAKLAEFLKSWGQGVGGGVNFWAGGGNNPNVPVPGENGALVRIPLPEPTLGPYPE